MEEPSPLMAVPPKETKVEERREDERQDARGKTANQGQTEFKMRDAYGNPPRQQDQESSYRAHHQVADNSVADSLHVFVCVCGGGGG